MKNLAIFSKIAESIFKAKSMQSCSALQSWVSQFREGKTSMRDKPRPERPAEAVTPTMMASVEVFVTLQEVANHFRIGKVLVHQILHKKIGISKVIVGGC